MDDFRWNHTFHLPRNRPSSARAPSAIVIDEPELGLHPYAITLLSDLIHAAAERTQLVVSTQSPTLLDHFEPDKIIVVSRQKGRSTLARLNTEELEEWLAEYKIIRTKAL